MTRAARTIGTAGWLLGIAFPSWAQTYPFRALGPDDGLANPFVHALVQDASGYLWIGTGEGVARFDGTSAVMFTKADGLAEDPVSALLAAPDGAVWAGHNEGGVSRWDGSRFRAVDLHGRSGSTIKALVPDSEGGLWVLALNEGPVHITASGRVLTAKCSDGPALWYALIRTSDGALIAGRGDGVRAYTMVNDSTLTPLPGTTGITYAPVLALATEGDRVFAGLDGEGVLAFHWTRSGPSSATAVLPEELGSSVVKGLTLDRTGDLIVATFGQGAYELAFTKDGAVRSVTRYHEGNGLGSNTVSTAFVDRENGLWLSRFSMGVARRLDRAVTWYAANEGGPADVRSIGLVQNDVWLGTAAGAILVVSGSTGAITDTLDARIGLPNDGITAIAIGPDDRAWAGTERSGLFVQGTDGRFAPEVLGTDHLSRHVHGLSVLNGQLWVATGNGVYVTGEGGRHLTTVTGLPHNSVNTVFTDRSGRVWMGCNNGGSAVQVEDQLRRSTLKDTHHITGITQDAKGAIWLATEGGGVLRDMVGTIEHMGKAEGLASDFVEAIAGDRAGFVWVAHRGGVSRIDVSTGAVRVLDRTLGLPPERKVNALAVGADGAIWIASAEGAVRYDPRMEEPSLAPPTVGIVAIRANDRPLDPTQAMVLDPDRYRLEFVFAGVSLKDPASITYRYKLEGHDVDWNTASAAEVQYRRLEPGSYHMLVQACNHGRCTGTVRSLELRVLAPIWQRAWFLISAAILVALGVLVAVRTRLRNQKRIQQYLERTLEERTREVHARTEEIERKNKDITDSITYARRIQQAALPAEHQLHAHFPRSFIFHQPRDIVSGDFYWFKRFEDKFLLACADCTGHGVPGAFMSMIGSMLLRDISANKEVNTPDAVLQRLDSELRNVLHYEGAEGRSNDGMDISVCEIDLHTRKLRAACAMHDLLVFRNGELVRVKGERWSIGGVQRTDRPNSFGRSEHDLRPGDRFYLYSDGIPDQFGGPAGRKLKVSGLIDLLHGIAHLPMDEQRNHFRTRFLEWMQGYEQVDDVLFIGIEV